jgi:CubicO group peptidase (beta-lactamase class C family)
MLNKTLDILQRGITDGLHLGAQLFVWRDNQTLADLGIGEARPGVPMTRDSINLWWSSVKPVVAVAIAQLWEQGKLDLDDRVANFIPEFAARGKEAITIRHLLTHTGGFRAWPTNIELSTPWDEIVAAVCEVPLEPSWVPGQKAGYHARTSWFMLGEIIRRIDGRMCDRYVRDEIFLPLGMRDSWLSIPPKEYRDYLIANRIAVMQDLGPTQSSVLSPQSSGIAGLPTESEAAYLHPGGSGRGPIRELGRFYEMLLNRGTLDGATILSPQTVLAITSPQRIGMFDNTFKHVIDWGFGFIVNWVRYSADTMPYAYGHAASPRTFGHSGQQSSCAFCDPDRKLIVAWVCNGMPGEIRHQQRQRAINAAIYEDLSLP